MKKILLLLAVTVMFTYRAESQSKTMYFSTSYTQMCWWNAATGKYDTCTGADEATLFKLNALQTMFHHTTDKIVSDYYVTTHTYDSAYNVYTYDVKSDAGNSYYFIIDVANSQIRIVGNNQSSENKTYMHVYTIKNSWTEE